MVFLLSQVPFEHLRNAAQGNATFESKNLFSISESAGKVVAVLGSVCIGVTFLG